MRGAIFNMHKVITIGLAFVVSGCGVKPASVTSVEVQPLKIQSFSLPRPGDSIVLGSNQIFLWPEGVTSTKAARVFKLNSQMDRIAERRRRNEQRQSKLENDPDTQEKNERIKDRKRDWNGKRANVNSVRANLNDRNRKLSKARTDLGAEQAKVTPNAAEVTRLQGLIVRYTNEAKDFSEKLQALQEEQDALQGQIDELNRDFERHQRKNKAELDRLADEISNAGKAGGEMITEIAGIVQLYNMGQSLVTMKTDLDGHLVMTISNWILDSSGIARTFSTEPGPSGVSTIQNLRYNPQGGIMDFELFVFEIDEVSAPLRETFDFHIARNNYKNGPDKVCFLGNITRKRVRTDGSIEIRKGIAKFMSGNS